tara:strand:- start:622 stop:798 length:177 start_codon:yes stop_codon:yes gene_type:complete
LERPKNHRGSRVILEGGGVWMSKGRSGVLGEKQKRRTRQAATIISVEKAQALLNIAVY